MCVDSAKLRLTFTRKLPRRIRRKIPAKIAGKFARIKTNQSSNTGPDKESTDLANH